ncbi:MAG: penicillin acylase family protein, partial [Terriglobales bacterium]
RGALLPLEFRLLRYRPEAWQPRDSLALAAYMYNVLASGYDSKLMRETFTAKLGPALAAQLFPERSPWDIPPGSYRAASGRPAGQRSELPVFAAVWGAATGRHGGSNNWVVSGAHSFSGHPILANDPHLQFQIPGLWWAAELTSPQVEVAGVAITGVPGIIVGHNQAIAWGVTNSMADVQDLYRETLDGKGNVLTPQGWRPLEHWHEVIRVKGQGEVTLDVPVTPHGPLIASDGGGKLALAWSLYSPGALQATHVFFALDQAQNWQEFTTALADFGGPPQNFVYADTSGHIGYQLAGWIPRRAGFDGAVPVPGASAAYGWQGWIPFSQLPRVFDPAGGILATANGRIAPDGYRPTLSTTWDAPNRTRRIYALLGGLPRWNARAMGRVQTDVISEQDGDFAAALVAAGKDVVAPAAVQAALHQLEGYRGDMSHTSVAATLAYQTREELLHEVVAAKTGERLARKYHWDMAPVFEQWLVQAHPAQWLPPGYSGAHAWDQLLLHCLAEVVGRGPQPWGRRETLSLLHPIYSRIPFLRQHADLGPVELDGSPLTVKQARNTALGNSSTLGPSMRFIADLGDWDDSSLTLVTGESGRLFDPHYSDNFTAYLRGEGLRLWFTPAAVAAHAAHHLQLNPGH